MFFAAIKTTVQIFEATMINHSTSVWLKIIYF